jgi:hypothetical protein
MILKSMNFDADPWQRDLVLSWHSWPRCSRRGCDCLIAVSAELSRCEFNRLFVTDCRQDVSGRFPLREP